MKTPACDDMRLREIDHLLKQVLPFARSVGIQRLDVVAFPR